MQIYFFMILCAIGMYWANKKYKKTGVAWGRPLAGLFGILALMMALGKIGFDLMGCASKSRQDEILDKELKYTQATFSYLGDYMQVKFKGSKVLIIANPMVEGANQYNERRLEVTKTALETAFDNKLQIVGVERLKMPDFAEDGMPPMLEMMFTAESFDAIIEQNSGADLILSLVGLPMDVKDMKFWDMPDDERPKLIVTNGQIYELRKAIQAGFINAVVYYNPNATYHFQDPVPKEPKEAFNKRYILIDPENVDTIAAENPSLFMPEE